MRDGTNEILRRVRRAASRPALAALAACVILGVVAGCGSDDDATTATAGGESSEALTKVKFRLNFAPTGNSAPIFLAEAGGYFEEEGLDVTIEPGKTAQLTNNEVNSGAIDIGLSVSPTMMLAIGEGQNLISIASYAGQGTFGVLVPEDSGITTMQDLVGKSVLVSSASPATPLLRSALAANDVDPDDVEVVNIDPAAFVNAYATGQGDAFSTAIPFGQPAVADRRPSRGLAFSEFGVPVPDLSIVARPDWVEDNRETAAAFVRAIQRAVGETAKNPQAAVDAMVEANPTLQADTMLNDLKAYLPYFCSKSTAGEPYGTHSEEEYATAADVLSEYAGLKGSTDPTRFFTNELIEGGEGIPDCPIVDEAPGDQ